MMLVSVASICVFVRTPSHGGRLAVSEPVSGLCVRGRASQPGVSCCSVLRVVACSMKGLSRGLGTAFHSDPR